MEIAITRGIIFAKTLNAGIVTSLKVNVLLKSSGFLFGLISCFLRLIFISASDCAITMNSRSFSLSCFQSDGVKVYLSTNPCKIRIFSG